MTCMRWSNGGTRALLNVLGPWRNGTQERLRAHCSAQARIHEALALAAARDEHTTCTEYENAAQYWEHAEDPQHAAGAWLRAGQPEAAVLAWRHAGDRQQAVRVAVTLGAAFEAGGEPAIAALALAAANRLDLVGPVCDRADAPFVGDAPWTIQVDQVWTDPDTGRGVRAVAVLVDPLNPHRRWAFDVADGDAVAVAIARLLDALKTASRMVERLEANSPGWAIRCDGRLPDWDVLGTWEISTVHVKSGRVLSGRGRDPLVACADLESKLTAARSSPTTP